MSIELELDQLQFYTISILSVKLRLGSKQKVINYLIRYITVPIRSNVKYCIAYAFAICIISNLIILSVIYFIFLVNLFITLQFFNFLCCNPENVYILIRPNNFKHAYPSIPWRLLSVVPKITKFS